MGCQASLLLPPFPIRLDRTCPEFGSADKLFQQMNLPRQTAVIRSLLPLIGSARRPGYVFGYSPVLRDRALSPSSGVSPTINQRWARRVMIVMRTYAASIWPEDWRGDRTWRAADVTER